MEAVFLIYERAGQRLCTEQNALFDGQSDADGVLDYNSSVYAFLLLCVIMIFRLLLLEWTV